VSQSRCGALLVGDSVAFVGSHCISTGKQRAPGVGQGWCHGLGSVAGVQFEVSWLLSLRVFVWYP
jgi:hypothetical protein